MAASVRWAAVPMTPYQAIAPFDWQAILTLIQTEFAFMDGRIDPPSSMLHLTAADIAAKSESGEVWVIGRPPVACMFLTKQADSLYLGKLAVSAALRGQGLARRLIEQAEDRARALGFAALELETRVELVENQATFRALGFVETGRKAHSGYSRPTSVQFRKTIQVK